MAMQGSLLQKLHRSLKCIPVLLLLLLYGGGRSAAADMIHELLRHHGLPAGLLPNTVRSFAMDEGTGLLEVRLDQPCYTRWQDSPVFFDQVVAGNLSYGELNGMVGLSQEELFLWLPVRGVAVPDPSSGVLVMDIGFALKELSLSLFEDPPDCRSRGDPREVRVSSPLRSQIGEQAKRFQLCVQS